MPGSLLIDTPNLYAKRKDMQEHTNKVTQKKGEKKQKELFEKKTQIAPNLSKAVRSNHVNKPSQRKRGAGQHRLPRPSAFKKHSRLGCATRYCYPSAEDAADASIPDAHAPPGSAAARK